MLMRSFICLSRYDCCSPDSSQKNSGILSSGSQMTSFRTTRTAVFLGFLILLASFGGCGSGSTSSTSSTPRISISPVSVLAGGPDLELTVTGVGFADQRHNRSIVVWSVNSRDTFLATTFVSSTELTAVIPAALLANPVSANVSVATGDPMASFPMPQSGSVSFYVYSLPPGSPSVSSISPMSAVAGSPDITLTVMGSAFVNQKHNDSRVVWSVNGSDTFLATTFVSSTELTAVIPATLLANPVVAKVLVETGDPIGSVPLSKTNAIDFTVTAP